MALGGHWHDEQHRGQQFRRPGCQWGHILANQDGVGLGSGASHNLIGTDGTGVRAIPNSTEVGINEGRDCVQ